MANNNKKSSKPSHVISQAMLIAACLQSLRLLSRNHEISKHLRRQGIQRILAQLVAKLEHTETNKYAIIYMLSHVTDLLGELVEVFSRGISGGIFSGN